MVRGRTTVSKTKTVIPSYITQIAALASKAAWKSDFTAEVIELRNFCKRQKGFSNIRSWKFEWYFDEYGSVTVFQEVKITDRNGVKYEFS